MGKKERRLGGHPYRVEIDTKMVLDYGKVLSVKDGVVRASGLHKISVGEMVKIGEVYGMVLNLEIDVVAIVIFGAGKTVSEGDRIERTNSLMSIKVGTGVLVLNALGEPIDGKGPINATGTVRVERKAPGIITRKSVHEPVQTGIKAIGSLGEATKNSTVNNPGMQKVYYFCNGFNGVNRQILGSAYSLTKNSKIFGETPKAPFSSYNYIQRRTMFSGAGKVVSANKQKLYELSAVDVLTAIADPKNVDHIAGLPKTLQPTAVYEQFASLMMQKGTETTVTSDVLYLSTRIARMGTLRKSIDSAFSKSHADTQVKKIIVEGGATNSNIILVRELAAVFRIDIQDTVIEEIYILNPSTSVFTQEYRRQTGQETCDFVALIKTNKGVIKRAFDIKDGVIKVSKKSLLQSALVKEDQFFGILNNHQSKEKYFLETVQKYEGLKNTVKNPECQAHINQILETIALPLPLVEKISLINKLNIELRFLMDQNGLADTGFNPSIINVAEAKDYEGREFANVISKHPYIFTSMNARKKYLADVGETYIPHWAKSARLSKGTALEISLNSFEAFEEAINNM